MQDINDGNSSSGPRVFALTSLPEPPTNVLKGELLSGKSDICFLPGGYTPAKDEFSVVNDQLEDKFCHARLPYPDIEDDQARSFSVQDTQEAHRPDLTNADHANPLFSLYIDAESRSVTDDMVPVENSSEHNGSYFRAEKFSIQVQRVACEGDDGERLVERLEGILARLEPIHSRIGQLTAHLN